MRLPGWGVTKLCHARDLDLRVGYRVVVSTEAGTLIGRVALTPRRREPYAEPYDILRVVTASDEREESERRELGRHIRSEAQKYARDHRIEGVTFIGCDVSLDGVHAEVKYQTEAKELNLSPVRDGLAQEFEVWVALRRYTFIERSAEASGCDTCGLPLCCSVWSGARSMGPVNARLARQQWVTPNEKIVGCCGEVKCCIRYEHDAYKDFKQRASSRNSEVAVGEKQGRVVDHSMVKDSVVVRFGSEGGERAWIPLGRLARDNPGVMPAFPEDWEVSGPEEDSSEDGSPMGADV